MSRLGRELRVATREGVVVSAVAAVALGALFMAVVRRPGLAVPERAALGALIALLVFAWGVLVSYVYGDARRRGMRHVIWTLVAVFVPNGLGFIAYFLLREPVLERCPACGTAARRDFAFCPQCGAPLPRACPQCRRPTEAGWGHCAHCGVRLEPARAAG